MSKPGAGNYEMSPYGGPLSKETDTTYGGAKPGKAPTLKQPQAPDPYKLIEEQAKVNRPNQVGPLGSTKYTKDPNTGYWTETKEFSPDIQKLYDERVGMLHGDINTRQLPGVGDFADLSKQAQDATYQQMTSTLDPQFQKQESDLTSNLANQGITQGSEAYSKAIDDFNRQKQGAYNQARLSSVGAGNERQGQLFSQGLQSAAQDFNQQVGRRKQLFNELAPLIGVGQIGGSPELDVSGPFNQQYQSQVNAVNSANQYGAAQNANKTQGAASLAGLLASLFL